MYICTHVYVLMCNYYTIICQPYLYVVWFCPITNLAGITHQKNAIFPFLPDVHFWQRTNLTKSSFELVQVWLSPNIGQVQVWQSSHGLNMSMFEQIQVCLSLSLTKSRFDWVPVSRISSWAKFCLAKLVLFDQVCFFLV